MNSTIIEVSNIEIKNEVDNLFDELSEKEEGDDN